MSDEERRVEELLRINAELAAEIRSLTLERTTAPRSGAMPAARRIARIVEERDALSGQLEAARAELDGLRGERDGLEHRNRQLEHHNRELGQHIHELDQEVTRLRTSVSGLLRRVRARILRS